MTTLWYEKYRPSTLENYIWKNEEVQKQIEKIVLSKALPNLILAGPSGTGKTTLARILPNELGIEEADFLSMNSSDKNSVADIRNDIISFCETAGWSGLKVVLLDEAERLTRDAQEALRGVIDTYTDTVRFIFTCNDVSRIRDALKSRCRTIIIDSLDQDSYLEKLISICLEEDIDLDDSGTQEAIQEILTICYPDLRKAIDTLEDWNHDGKLIKPSKETNVAKEWEETLLDYIHTDADVSLVRNMVSSFSKDDIEDVYSFLCRRSHDISDAAEKDAIIIIADHQFRHNLVSHPDINLLSCIIKLMKLVLNTGNGV